MSRGPEKQFDPNVALERAMQLFWANGYTGTGLRDLLEVMQIGRKSMYDTFGNKRDLYIKAVKQYSRTVIASFNHDMNDTGKTIHSNVELVLKKLAKRDALPMSKGCMLGVSLAQFRTDDREMAELLREHMLLVENVFHQAFNKAQQNGELKSSTDTRNLARLFLSVIQGMSMVSRVVETGRFPNGVAKAAIAVLKMS